MAASTNLEITNLTEAQSQKHVTVNEAINEFDGAVAGHDGTNIDFPSDADYTPTKADCLAAFHLDVVSTFGNLTTTRHVFLPANAKLYFITNSTANSQTITIEVTGTSAGVDITTGASMLVYCDGTDILSVAAEV